LNGQPVQDSNDLIAKVAASTVGQTVSLTLLRDVDGKLERHTVTAALADRSESMPTDNDLPAREKAEKDKSNSARLGLTLTDLTAKIVEDNHLNGVKGLFVKSVDPNGLIADMPDSVRVRENEVITRINRIPVNTLADFQRVIDSLKPGDAVVLNLSSYYRPENRVSSRIVQFTYQ
jgi:S1-C subfamily serine protease